jgi:hypothetical protein
MSAARSVGTSTTGTGYEAISFSSTLPIGHDDLDVGTGDGSAHAVGRAVQSAKGVLMEAPSSLILGDDDVAVQVGDRFGGRHHTQQDHLGIGPGNGLRDGECPLRLRGAVERDQDAVERGGFHVEAPFAPS